MKTGHFYGCWRSDMPEHSACAKTALVLYSEVYEALQRSPFDIAPCRICGEPVVCLPDGLPACVNCVEKEEAEQ